MNTLIWWGWTSAVFGLPLVLAFCLVAGIASRGRVRMQLLIMATVSVALYLVVPTLEVYAPIALGLGLSLWNRDTLAALWVALAVVVLVWAMLSLRGGWRLRRFPALLGMVMPLPLMLYFAWDYARFLASL